MPSKALSTLKSSPSAPALASRSLDTLMRKAMSALEPLEGSYRSKAIRASAAPKGADRAALIERRDELASALVGSDPDEIQRSIAAVRAVLPSASSAEASNRLVMSAYISVLTQFPIWAINETCRRYLDNSLTNGGFAPSPPDVAGHCRKLVQPIAEEHAHLETILTAEVYDDPTPESLARTSEAEAAIMEAARSRAVAYWENEVRPSLKARDTSAPKPETPEQIMERLEAMKANPPKIVIGEGVLSTLKDIAAKSRPGEAA